MKLLDSTSHLSRKNRFLMGFTLIELLVVIAIIGFLATMTTAYTISARKKARDIRRLADITQIQTALELYRSKLAGGFPTTDSYGEAEISGWDTSIMDIDGDGKMWLDFLADEGLMVRVPGDPFNNSNYHYRYERFPDAARGDYGCGRAFYIIQITNFETDMKNHGYGQCPNRNFMAEAPNGFTIQIFE